MSGTRTFIMAAIALAAGAGVIIAASQFGLLRPDSSHDDHDQGQPPAVMTTLVSTTSADESEIEVIETDVPAFRTQRSPSITCSNERQVIQFASPEIAIRMGLSTVRAEQKPITRSLQCNAELVFNGDRYAHIAPRAPGIVHRVEKTLGDQVKTGETLAIIDSADLAAAKAEYLQAIASERMWRTHLERKSLLAESEITSRRELLEAETQCAEACIALARAQQRLRNLGLTATDINAGSTSSHTDNPAPQEQSRAERLHVDPSMLSSDDSLLHITAPFDGVVVERHAVLGEVVDTEHPMFSIAGVEPGTDRPSLWMMLDIYENDAPLVALGQRVVFHQSGRAGDPIAGVIAWISPQVDPVTRTLKARAGITNADGALRANTFGRANIIIHDREELLVVPRAAVQWEGCCNVVFVRQSDTRYQPKKVKLGFETDGWCVITDGLQPNDLVVAEGSFLLKTELLKGSIGAGCCADH